MFGCTLTQFLTGRKQDSHSKLEALGLYSSIVKRSLQEQCKNYPETNDQTRRGRSHHRPLDTPPMVIKKKKIF